MFLNNKINKQIILRPINDMIWENYGKKDDYPFIRYTDGKELASTIIKLINKKEDITDTLYNFFNKKYNIKTITECSEKIMNDRPAMRVKGICYCDNNLF